MTFLEQEENAELLLLLLLKTRKKSSGGIKLAFSNKSRDLAVSCLLVRLLGDQWLLQSAENISN